MKDQNIISKRFIESVEYHNLMFKYLDADADMYNIPYHSENFKYRARDLKYLGAWRWMSVYQYQGIIKDLIFSDKRGIDFGGSLGPIGGNTLIVDIHTSSLFKDLLEFDSNSVDYIFSSHTLEHIKCFMAELAKMYEILKKNGKLLLILPSYKMKEWNVGAFNTHYWNFILSSDENTKKFPDRPYYNEYFREIDKIVKLVGFKILEAKYCWDNSIWIYAEK